MLAALAMADVDLTVPLVPASNGSWPRRSSSSKNAEVGSPATPLVFIARSSIEVPKRRHLYAGQPDCNEVDSKTTNRHATCRPYAAAV